MRRLPDSMIRRFLVPGLIALGVPLASGACTEDTVDVPRGKTQDLPWNPQFEADYNRLEPRPGVEPVTKEQQDQVVVSKDALEFPATADSVKKWAPGRIVVGGPGEGGTNPFGFARRVKSVKTENGKLIVKTEPVGLQDIVVGDLQVRLDNQGTPADLSKVDKKLVAQTFYGQPVLSSLRNLKPLKSDPKFKKSSTANMPGGQNGLFSSIASFAEKVTGAPPGSVSKVAEVVIPPEVSKKVEQLSQGVEGAGTMVGQVLQTTEGVLTQAGQEFVKQGGDLANQIQTTVDQTGREVVNFGQQVGNETGNLLRQVRAGIASVTPATFDGTADLNQTLSQTGEWQILNPGAELTKKVNVGDYAVEFFINGDIRVKYAASVNPGFQLGVSVPNPIQTAPPPFKTWLNVDARVEADVSLNAKFNAGMRGAEQDNALQDALSAGQEAAQQLLSEEKDALEGDDDLKPEGTFTKVLYVSTPKVFTFMAGPVPVALTSTFQLNLVCGFEAKATLDAKLNFKRTATLKFKTEYTQTGGMQMIELPAYTYVESDTKEILGGGKIQASCGLVPRINAFVYDSLGIYAGIRGSLIAEAEYESKCAPNSTTPKAELEASLKFQAAVQAGLRAQVPGSSFGGKEATDLGIETDPFEPWDKDWTIWSRTWNFDRGLGYCTPTCTNGKTSSAEEETDVDCGDACTACDPGKKCEEDTDCKGRSTCVGGICGADNCTNGRQDGLELGVDCGGPECGNKCGDGSTCYGDSDCTSGQCSVAFVCVSDSCTNGKRDPGECGRDCGGPCQAKCPDNEQCNDGTQCASGASNGWICTDPCRDFRLTPGESDVDCGGQNNCYRCPAGLKCTGDSDCQGGLVCQGGVCNVLPAASCTDRLQNQTETGVDCGGECPAKCDAGSGCGVGADCKDFICTNNVCAAASCTDFVKNGNETSQDCGGSCPRCAAGLPCRANTDCATDVCTNGTCAGAHKVGGTVSGLSGSVTLALGNDQVTVNQDGTFTFSPEIVVGSPYSVSIVAQPTGQTCQVANGSGQMVPGGVTNVTVTCTTNTYDLGGTVSGATGALVLSNNGSPLNVAGNGTFTFAQKVAYGSAYAVTVTTAPAGQTCAVANGSGTMGTANVTNVTVTCTTQTFTVGGTVTGATGALTLRNNGTDPLNLSGNGAFTFAQAIGVGQAYAVTVTNPPAGQTCSVASGTGTMGTANVTNVAVTCQTATVGTDCQAILAANPQSTNGIYSIDPDGSGTIAPFNVYCDMTGGGWTQIFDNAIANGFLLPSVWRQGVTTTPPNGGQWTVMQHMAAFAGAGGVYRFSLRWNAGEDQYVQWEQTSNPLVGRGTVSNVVMVPTNQVGYGGAFAGFGVELDERAALDGEPGGAYAWAIGIQNQFGAGIPAWASSSLGGAYQSTRARLYFRR
jgi:hypothetical protein